MYKLTITSCIHKLTLIFFLKKKKKKKPTTEYIIHRYITNFFKDLFIILYFRVKKNQIDTKGTGISLKS